MIIPCRSQHVPINKTEGRGKVNTHYVVTERGSQLQIPAQYKFCLFGGSRDVGAPQDVGVRAQGASLTQAPCRRSLS